MDILKLIAVAVFILSGCASPTKGMTPEQATAYTVQAEYERIERRDRRHDDIFAARRACKEDGYVWWIKSFSSFDVRRMDRDPNWLPRNAHLFDFACMSGRDSTDALNRMIGGRMGRF